MGQDKQAKRLVVGFRALEVQNHPKGDRDLWFATHTLNSLEAALEPSELPAFMMVWRPSAAVEGLLARPSGLAGSGLPEAGGARSVMYSDEVSWRRYTFTALGGIYRMFFGVDVAGSGPAAKGIEHDFVYIK